MIVAPLADDLYTAVKGFLVTALDIAPAQVVKGLGNRVSAPVGGSAGSSYIVMTQLTRLRLRTNIDTWDGTDPTSLSFEQGVEVMLQLDVFGVNAADLATIITTLWRDDYACLALGAVCQPLYCDEPRLMPFIDGEEQYEQRYTISAHLQYNPTVSVPQQFANVAQVSVIDVDEKYAP